MKVRISFKKLIWFFLLMKIYGKIIVATYIFTLFHCFSFRALRLRLQKIFFPSTTLALIT